MRGRGVITLSAGQRLTALDRLATRASTGQHRFTPTNAASIDARHRFVRLRLPHGGLPYLNETIAYLVDGELRYRFGPGQDPRAAWLGNDLLVFYSRVADPSQPIGTRPRRWVKMGVRNMSAPSRETILREPREASSVIQKFTPWEKNWTPFLHAGTLFLSYRLEPHVVLQCDWQTGGCAVAHKTNASRVWAHHRTSLRMGARGSSPAVWLRPAGVYVGIAHFRNPDGVYDHCLYAFNATPPFRMLGSSPRFMFNTSDRIQFVAGLYRRRDVLIVSYGADDSYSMEAEIPVSRALELLGRSAADAGSDSRSGLALLT